MECIGSIGDLLHEVEKLACALITRLGGHQCRMQTRWSMAYKACRNLGLVVAHHLPSLTAYLCNFIPLAVDALPTGQYVWPRLLAMACLLLRLHVPYNISVYKSKRCGG